MCAPLVCSKPMGRHNEWRKLAKKCRRSRVRRLKAKERELLLQEEEQKRLRSPSYQTWQKEQEALELFARVESERIREENNRLWIERELVAQKEWRKTQEKLELFKAEKAKQELKIREEWEREQNKIKEIEEKNRREKEEKEAQAEAFKQKVQDFIAGDCDTLPDEFSVITQTNPDKEMCPFYSKVGACRFFQHCSRNHVKPSVSKTLVLPGVFSYFGLDNKAVHEYDTDANLEYEEGDLYDHFLDFYDDFLSELRTFGQVSQFKVCCNTSTHLKGNVYISYSHEREALKAHYALSGRFYGGKQITAQFCIIPQWTKALCGLFLKKRCPKGGTCNFLHTFPNPTSEFNRADFDHYEKRDLSRSSSRKHSSWGWNSGSDSESDDQNYKRKSSSRRSSYSSSSPSRYKYKRHNESQKQIRERSRRNTNEKSCESNRETCRDRSICDNKKHESESRKDNSERRSKNNSDTEHCSYKRRKERSRSRDIRRSRSKERSYSKDRVKKKRSKDKSIDAIR